MLNLAAACLQGLGPCVCWKTRCSDRREVGSDSLWHRPNPHTPPGSATVADLPAATTASASSAGISGLTRGGHSAAFAAAVVLALAEASLALTVRACSWVVAWRTAVLILEGIATRMHAHAGKWWWWWFRPASNAFSLYYEEHKNHVQRTAAVTCIRYTRISVDLITKYKMVSERVRHSQSSNYNQNCAVAKHHRLPEETVKAADKHE